MQIIPAIDLREGRCVRLYQGDFERETHYSDQPLEVAEKFRHLGLSSLHVVDLDGARSGTQRNRHTVETLIGATDLSVQLGGGIRDAATVRRWLDSGVRRCVVGSLAIEEPQTVRSWLREFGPAQLVLALDVRLADDGAPQLATHGWAKACNTTLWECIDAYLPHGLSQVLCTDISRDGALSGPNFSLYRKISDRYPSLRLQASGGVRHIDDLRALRELDVFAAITGRALLDGRIQQQEIESFLPAA